MPWKRLASGKGLARLLTGGGIFFLLSLSFNASAQAIAPQPGDTPARAPVPALTINNTTFGSRALTLMLALVQRDDPAIDSGLFVDAVIESHLVASHVREKDALMRVLDSNGVGFQPRVQIDNRQVATLRALFAEPLAGAVQALGDAGLNALLLAPLAPDMAAVSAVLGEGPRHIYTLSDEELKAAHRVTLAQYRFPGEQEARTVTLGELYQRQNVQGRMALHSGDATWLAREAQLYIGQQFVRWWTTTQSAEDVATIDAINTLVEDRMLRQAWLAHTGVSAEIHAGNPALKRAATDVTREQVQRWYQQHQDRFREVKRARAWVARCASKALCEAIGSTGDAGDTETVAISSRWYQRGADQDWLTDVVLMQAGEALSRTIRAPQGDGWFRIQVLERQWHTHPVDSLTVDIVARREIARDQLVNAYLALTSRLRQQARIERLPPAGPAS